MNNILALILSYSFFLFLGLLSTILNKLQLLDDEGSRKFIHILGVFWWFIAIHAFSNFLYAAIVPLTFIFLNYISYKYRIVDAIERNNGNHDMGSVYYPISLFLLCLFTYLIKEQYIGALGVFMMGYGDGFAAVIGRRFNGRKIYEEKTLSGTLTMFFFSFLVSMIILSRFHNGPIIFISLFLALLATSLELYTPYGLDNITVPLTISLAYYLLFYTA